MLPLEKMLDIRLLKQDKRHYKTANVFGFVAYSERNPYIVKLLRDEDFWRSLNARAEGWILYAISPNSQFYDGGNALYINDSLGIKPEEYPQLVILCIGPNDEMIQKNYPISAASLDEAYDSIEKAINTVTNTVKNICPNNRNSMNVSREVLKDLDAQVVKEKWKRVSAGMQTFVLSIISKLF